MPATIIFPCPGCDVHIEAPVHLLGLRRRCPECKTPFVVRPHKPRSSPAEFLWVVAPIASAPRAEAVLYDE
jgi:hypothetical protein